MQGRFCLEETREDNHKEEIRDRLGMKEKEFRLRRLEGELETEKEKSERAKGEVALLKEQLANKDSQINALNRLCTGPEASASEQDCPWVDKFWMG